MTPVIRALAPDDSISELTELMHRAYAPLLARGLRYTAGYQDEETTRRRIADGECFVLILDERIAGTITWHPPARAGGAPWYDRDGVATFQQLCVDPPFQRRGVAKALLEHVEERARASGATELACDTAEPAADLIAMYVSFGYRVVGSVDWDATNYASVILSKAL